MDDGSSVAAVRDLDLMAPAFEAAIARLRGDDWAKRDARVRELSQIIAKEAERNWRLTTMEGGPFHISRAQHEFRYSREEFLPVCSAVADSIAACADRKIQECWQKLEAHGLGRSYIFELYLATFLAHELLHLEQHLGSEQYRDSDYYLQAVAAVDYQADFGALQYVLGVYEADCPLSRNELFLVLVAAHLASMHAFSPWAEGETYPGDAFERLLIWYFQLARIALSEHNINPAHPSLEMMPIINLPRMGREFGSPVDPQRLARQSNSAAQARQDIVVAVSDARGVQTIRRMASTDASRVDRLVANILKGDVGGVREELAEFLAGHAVLADFQKRSRGHERLVQSLSGALAAAQELAHADPTPAPNSREVITFFERVDALLAHSRPGLKGEWVSTARDRYGDDALASVLAEGSGDEPPEEKSERVLREVRRLAIRLSTSLDAEDAG